MGPGCLSQLKHGVLLGHEAWQHCQFRLCIPLRRRTGVSYSSRSLHIVSVYQTRLHTCLQGAPSVKARLAGDCTQVKLAQLQACLAPAVRRENTEGQQAKMSQ